MHTPWDRNTRLFGIGALVLLWLIASGCPKGPILSRQALGGADPMRDFAASPQLQRLRSHKVTALSVRGIRLMDPIERVLKLWGKPKRVHKQQYIWTDKEGNYRVRVLLGRQILKKPGRRVSRLRVVVRRIDVFSPFQPDLHPDNRVLLDPKRIRSASWRNQIFGLQGKQTESHLKRSIQFPTKGFGFLLFSQLLPLHRKVKAVFSLFLNDEQLNQQRIIPIS